MPFIVFCREKGIELVALYQNATHILQPLDVAFFHPLKNKWKKAVYDFLEETVDTLDFRIVFKSVFRVCGLNPLNAVQSITKKSLKPIYSIKQHLHMRNEGLFSFWKRAFIGNREKIEIEEEKMKQIERMEELKSVKTES